MGTATPEAVAPAFGIIPRVTSAGGLLRFSTAGSVDDGKSTLIGRLLFDSRAVYEDQLDSVRESKVNRSGGPIDFSLLTDGLRAEREQGITIDVAHRYFSTPRRKFIIADTPGHEQYTRNMATGASTADAAVVLIDANKGLLQQSRRHAFIVSLLGVQHIVAAVNKMDLVGFSQDMFERIASEFRDFAARLGVESVYPVPVSALQGDNVVRRSSHMPWFEGPTLLEYLEKLSVTDSLAFEPLRFPIQYVIRPDAGFRGYAGQVASGVLRRGERVVALPSGVKTRIKSIVTFDGELQEAAAGSSVSVTLEDEIDISRGDLLAAEEDPPAVAHEFRAMLVWMHRGRLELGKDYLLKHTTRTVRARARRLRHRVDVNTLEEVPASILEMNEIGAVDIQTTLPLFLDAYCRNRTMGSFILIDPITNATVAAGIIESMTGRGPAFPAEIVAERTGKITPEERARRLGHGPAAVWIRGRPRVAEIVERLLFEEGWHAQLIDTQDFPGSGLIPAAKLSHHAGMVAVFSAPPSDGFPRQTVRAIFGADAFFEFGQDNEDDEETAARIIRGLLRSRELKVDSRGGKR